MPRRSSTALLGLALALAFALWAWRGREVAEPVTGVATEEAAAPAPAAPRRRARPSPRTPANPPPASGIDCAPSAAEQCMMGDVWLVDSCGNPEEKLEECDDRDCKDDACAPAPSTPCNEPPYGRCEGDVVHLCHGGKPLKIDCRTKGLRCAMGDEGAECQPDVPRALRCSGRPRCEGDTLLSCDSGRLVRTDCTRLRAKCATVDGATAPSCVALPALDPDALPCGPCGCPPEALGPERCDNRDDDADGFVDEGLDCGPVPVIAFLFTDAAGQRSHAEEDIEAELRRVNQTFSPTGLSFVIDELILLSAPGLLELDQDEFEKLAVDPRLHPKRNEFYVPLVFTDRVLSGETPKSGLATLPNGTCGGMQEGYGPDVGVVAVAKARFPTTVAHELGHFLGLCHTHEQQESASFIAYPNRQTGALTACLPTCRGEGDGVCDTPPDPGPERCTYDPDCQSFCGTGAEPDPKNLMSYYTGCRHRFTAEQARLMQHTLALRRGWHRCAGRSCACQLGDPSCPTGMTCRPVRLSDGSDAARCTLDGARPAGADCEAHAQCGAGAICLSEQQSGVRRCIRACRGSTPGCSCREAGPDLSICMEDLAR